MAATTQNLACTASARISANQKTANDHTSQTYRFALWNESYVVVLLKLAPLPAGLARARLYSAALDLHFNRDVTGDYYNISYFRIEESFNTNTVNWNTAPERGALVRHVRHTAGSGQLAATVDYWTNSATTREKSEQAKRALKDTGVYMQSGGSLIYGIDDYFDLYTNNASESLRPLMTISYDNAEIIDSQIEISNGPTGGYVNPRNATSFAWDFHLDTSSYFCLADDSDIVQASATLYWSDDDGATWNSVAASGSTQSLTVPANTFPVGTSVQYYISATDTAGSTSQTPTYTISTADSLPTTTLISPISTLEAKDQAITFRWTSANQTGTVPTAFQFAWRDASVTPASWTQFKIVGSTPEYTMPANTLPAGTIIWTVAAFNLDDVMGPWASQAQIRVIGAPDAPVVTADAVPFATITWQVNGQQAWRLTVDGKTYGPYFGGDKSFTLPDYLEDGEHTAAVEVQGVYGLWSQPGAVTFTVTNVPEDQVRLQAVCYRDAALTWMTGGTTTDFLIYRDGVRIGHTANLSFTDRRSIGRHRWQVINRLAGGYYTASNIVQGELRSCTPAVAPLAGGEWLELKKSDAQTREETWIQSQTAAIRHFAGEEYPSAEFAAFKDESVGITVAWMPEEADEARRFESLIGVPVIYKNKDRMLIGVLQAFNLNRPKFYRSYSVTLTRIHWRDFVDEDA